MLSAICKPTASSPAHPDASLAATCFHAQQSVEKALKAVLTARGATFPRTHNLERARLARGSERYRPGRSREGFATAHAFRGGFSL
ncbi:MAG: hypothetical protein CRU78_14645 [Candidatus Accumulibacter phosphatis]|uniref:HEPN domain-containing protein n=1 Tax=Candidatus Accumulibacter phosphatis TaxID=327160 RepID=A0A6A7RVV4_9PROT|nr:hypothetical protein [Candidatus Accumulibacter phosphatis]